MSDKLYKAINNEKIELTAEEVAELETKIYVVLNDHSEEIDALKKRPVSNGEGPAIDMSQFCSNDEYLNLL